MYYTDLGPTVTHTLLFASIYSRYIVFLTPFVVRKTLLFCEESKASGSTSKRVHGCVNDPSDSPWP